MMFFFSPLEQFEVVPILGIFCIPFFSNNVFSLIFCLLITFFFWFGALHSGVVPVSRLVVVELIYDFVLKLVSESLKNFGQRYFPLVFTVFFFVVVSNLLGNVPLAFTLTSHFVITFSLSFILFFGINIVGFRRHGLHFLSFFLPDVPLILGPFLTAIEIVSYLFRVLSLAIRLFANIMAGHILLHIFADFVVQFPIFNFYLFLLHVIPCSLVMFLVCAVFFLEVLISILQAYVFSLLVCLYLNDALHLHS